MELNLKLIIAASLIEFALSAVWYGVVFAKLWGAVIGSHDVDGNIKSEHKQLLSNKKSLYKILFLQFVLTSFLNTALYLLIKNSTLDQYAISLVLWSGFIVPLAAADAVWSIAPTPLRFKKFGIIAGIHLACLLLSAYIFSL